MDTLPEIDSQEQTETQNTEEKTEVQQVDMKPWDKSWTLSELRGSAREWNLAHDYGVIYFFLSLYSFFLI